MASESDTNIRVEQQVGTVGPGARVVGVEIHVAPELAHDVNGLANPFLGLQTFTYADRAKYSGRNSDIAKAVTKLTTPGAPRTLLFITGASGCGKSSLARAGIAPALESHYGGFTVKCAVFRPSSNPLAGLNDAFWRQLGLPSFDPSKCTPESLHPLLCDPPPRQINVLVIDQFEELFTQSDLKARDTLFALLTGLPPFPQSRTHVIATLRADYLPELFASAALYEIAKDGIDLRAMTSDELPDAIQQPLRSAYPDGSKRFQPELVTRLASDAAEDATYLPLLQVTLEDLWRRGSLTLGAYSNLTDAIKQRADQVLAFEDYDDKAPQQPRPADDRALMLELFLELMNPSLDDDAHRDVRRTRPRDELEGVGDDAAKQRRARLIEVLTQARLFSATTCDERVEVDIIHETLLTNWGQLRDAITDRRRQLKQRARFEQQLQEWRTNQRMGAYLLTGVRLAEARELEQRDDIALRGPEAQALLRRSVEQANAEQQRRARNLRRIVAAQTLGLIAIGAAGWYAYRERNKAEASAAVAHEQQEIAFSRQLAAQAMAHLDDRLDLALLLSVEANRVKPTLGARSALLTALEHRPNLARFVHGHASEVQTVAFSPDGSLLASASAAGASDKRNVVRLSDVATGQAIHESIMEPKSPVQKLTFSPDGRLLALGTADGAVILWDVATGRPTGPPLLGHQRGVQSLAFSPSGKLLASGGCGGRDVEGTCDRGEILLWDIATHRQVGPRLLEHRSAVSALAFNADGTLLASGNGGPLYFQLVGRDYTISLWDMTTYTQIGSPLIGHMREIRSVSFSADGKVLASAGSDRTVKLWEVATRQPIESVRPFFGDSEPALSTDHEILEVIFGATNGTLRWIDSANLFSEADLDFWPDDHHQLKFSVSHISVQDGRARADRFALRSAAISRDGSRWAAGSCAMLSSNGNCDLGELSLWSVAVESSIATALLGHTGSVFSVAFSPDGKLLASGGEHHEIILWDVATRKAVGPSPAGPLADIEKLAFSADGRTLAAGTCAQAKADERKFEECKAGAIYLWDARTRQPLGEPLRGHSQSVTALAFHPTRNLLASSGDHDIILWDVTTGKMLHRFATGHRYAVSSLAFTPDGRTLASSSCSKEGQRSGAFEWGTGCIEGEVRFWDVDLYQMSGAPITGHTDMVNDLAFSPDGKTWASAGARFDGRILLWDVVPRQPEHRVLVGPNGGVSRIRYSADGQVLASCNETGGGGAITLWDVEARQPIGLPLTCPKSIHDLSFSPDGKRLASASWDGSVVLWDVSTKAWEEIARRIANRPLTSAERDFYLNGDTPGRPAALPGATASSGRIP